MGKNQEAELQEGGFHPSEWLDNTITQAIAAGASDIHFNPLRDVFEVFFRVDGVLNFVESLPLAYLETAMTRLRVMAQLDITERRRPQDGHIVFQPKTFAHPQPVDLRISLFPTIFGESAVIRILSKKNMLFEAVEKLGIKEEIVQNLKTALQKNAGMILVTGPGGSGKTTTLYTLLNYLQSQKPIRSILTLEDPVELYLAGIKQSQIHPEIGFTFAAGLRSVLRQDADTVMVGEIRDDETAEIAIRASFMGMLLFSTMHTTNSLGAITRFLEFKLPRSLIASAILVIIAQRLVRAICPHCKAPAKYDEKTLNLHGISAVDAAAFYRGKGCVSCGNTGYSGRLGIFEFLFVNKKIQQLIIEGAPIAKIEKQAESDGMETLAEAAVKKSLEGLTTLEEVARVVPM